MNWTTYYCVLENDNLIKIVNQTKEKEAPDSSFALIRALQCCISESGASFSFVWLTILIILLIPIFALNDNLRLYSHNGAKASTRSSDLV